MKGGEATEAKSAFGRPPAFDAVENLPVAHINMVLADELKTKSNQCISDGGYIEVILAAVAPFADIPLRDCIIVQRRPKDYQKLLD